MTKRTRWTAIITYFRVGNTALDKWHDLLPIASFVTTKPSPGDVDMFLLMVDSFDVTHVHGEAALVFQSQKAQNVLGASIFWIRIQLTIGNEQGIVEDWQIKRDTSRRGIVEVIHNDSE